MPSGTAASRAGTPTGPILWVTSSFLWMDRRVTSASTGQVVDNSSSTGVRAAAPGHDAGSNSNGTSWSAEVSEPCMPTREDTSTSDWLAITAAGPAGATTTSPIRPASQGSTGPNQPAPTAS